MDPHAFRVGVGSRREVSAHGGGCSSDMYQRGAAHSPFGSTSCDGRVPSAVLVWVPQRTSGVRGGRARVNDTRGARGKGAHAPVGARVHDVEHTAHTHSWRHHRQSQNVWAAARAVRPTVVHSSGERRGGIVAASWLGSWPLGLLASWPSSWPGQELRKARVPPRRLDGSGSTPPTRADARAAAGQAWTRWPGTA